MAKLKLAKFLGEAPKLAAELLPETVAQYAIGCKLYSGNLQPFPAPALVESLTRVGTIKSLYLMRNAGVRYWLSWTTDVDVAVSQLESDTSQRIYYTGDGAPKQTDFTLATTSGVDYPVAYRPLGLPAPAAECTAVTTSSSTISITNRARSGNIATVTLSSAPNFGEGTVVTIAGVGGTGYNLSGVSVIEISGSDIKYNSPGADEATTASGGGTVAFAGLASLRNYVYTWVTDWDEESQPSLASANCSAYSGQEVTVGGLPTTAPTGYAGIVDRKRIYRTVTAVSGTYYAYVAEVTLATSSYSDKLTDAATGDPIETQDYDMPESTMVGIVNLANGVLAGFFSNQLCFSEPYKPWAWPAKYRKTTTGDIVAIAALNSSIIVATDKAPAIAAGTHPSVINVTKLDVNYPCLSKRSMVNMGFGAMYAAPDGLVYISTSLGNENATKLIHHRDTWVAAVSPSTLLGKYYNNKYFGSYSTGSFIFERDEQIGGIYVEANFSMLAGYYDWEDGYLYYIDSSSPQQIKRWDDPTQVATSFDWWSKDYRLPKPVNLGAFKILADFGSNAAAMAATNNQIVEQNTLITDPRGAFGDYALDTQEFGGSLLTEILTSDAAAVLFSMYADGELVYQNYISDYYIHLLPAGYLSDKYSFRLSSAARVRELQVAETPTMLKEV